MRTSDIAYVPNVSKPTYVPPLEEMSLQEIVRTYLRSCAKSNGHPSVCRDCEQKCKYGERALSFFGVNATSAEQVDPNTTILARMKAEKEKTEKKEEKPTQKISRQRATFEQSLIWFTNAMAAEDPIAFTVKELGISKTQAKAKISNFKYQHRDDAERILSELRARKTKKAVVEPAPEKPQEAKVPKEAPKETAKKPEEPLDCSTGLGQELKTTIEMLTRKKEECAEKIREYSELLKKVSDRLEAAQLFMETFDLKG